MFFPFRDDNPTVRQPVVTIGLIAINVMVYLFFLFQGEPAYRQAIINLGLIPVEFTHMRNLYLSPSIHPFFNLFTTMFTHADFLHLAGNMWFLWIFGDNVEDRMGRVKFLLFFLLSGLVATLVHVIFNLSSAVPVVGASGAVSGVLGAYMVLFPQARVRTFIFIFIFIDIVMIPAVFFIGLWIAFQVINGLLSLGAGGGGVAWFAHIGGFLFGLYGLKLFVRKGPGTQSFHRV